MTPHSLISRGINGLVSALIAPACPVCAALLDEPLSGCVCARCWHSVLPITPPICDRCGDPVARAQPVCLRCVDSESAVERGRAIGEYEGVLREIIHALKYSGRVSLARPLAQRMRDRGRAVLNDIDGVVPVPLHWRREYQRGFNQAREIARHLGPPVVEALRRSRPTIPQVELAADRRRVNVAGAFVIRRRWLPGNAVHGKKLLLIDDVCTTGATLESCARVLRNSGAAEVYALTAARVVTRRSNRR